MYKHGHHGLALLFAAPAAVSYGTHSGPIFGILIITFALITARVPDIDQQISILTHRGFTHTLWFGLIISTILAFLVTQIGNLPALVTGSAPTDILRANNALFSMAQFGFMLGFVSHLVGDALTEAYDYTVKPLWPLSRRPFCLGWTTASSPLWNWGLLALGVVSSSVAVVLILS